MFGNFMMKTMLRSKLKDVPQEEQDKLLALIEKNPELFTQIAKEAQAHMKTGKDQMSAVAEALKAHEDELRLLTHGS